MQRGGTIGDFIAVRQTQSRTVDMLNLTPVIICIHTLALQSQLHAASSATIHDLSQHASNNPHLVTEKS